MRKTHPWLEEAKAVVFDFDGTLVDSNRIKWRGFERVFSDFPDRMGQIMAYCRSNSHTPRWEKFRTVYERILNLPYTPEKEKELLSLYEKETTKQVAAAPEIPGAGRFLSWVSSRLFTALLSSTPDPILRSLLAKRGWLGLFHQVQGAPVGKGGWLAELRKKNGYRWPQDLLFFGDTQEDARSASAAECLFIQVGEGESLEGTARIRDFKELLEE